MTDNLEKMIEGLEPNSFPTEEKDLDINLNEKQEEEVKLTKLKMNKSKTEKETITTSVIDFPSWFENNDDKFDNIRQIKLSVRGVDPKKVLIFSVLDPAGGKTKEGFDKRNLHLFREADKYFVLNLNAVSLDMFNNGFKIVHSTKDDDIFFKCYGIKTALIIVSCVRVGDKLIPYSKSRLKIKDNMINSTKVDKNKISKMFPKLADIEGLQIMYSQVIRDIDKIITNQDMINYLHEKQKKVVDVNHLIQIDTIIIDLLSSKCM